MSANRSIEELLVEQLSQATGDEIVDVLFAFMKQRGDSHYDEAVTQMEHALQCALFAQQRGFSDESITASLFHDIGHLLVDEHEAQTSFLDQDLVHEEAGARLLSKCFPPAVTTPVRLHVAAKRYLCTVDKSYFEQLSDASKRSFVLQGGPLSDVEQQELNSDPHLPLAVELRQLDDEGKRPDFPTPPIEAFRDAVARCLATV